MSNCIACVRYEFYCNGQHTGGGTEFVYENNPKAKELLSCKTLNEAKELLGENPDPEHRSVITQVELARGFLQ